MAFAASGEPDGLVLPAGFHATVVAEGLGALRHLAVRGNGNIYISTPQNQDPAKNGIIALHLDANHHADQIQHFGSIDGGTGIRFHNDRLYASTPSGVSRSHVPRQRTRSVERARHLFVALDASANLCTAQTQPPPGQPLPTTPPVGLKPCPDLETRAGVWRFDANKAKQRFPADGEQWRRASATLVRSTGRRPTVISILSDRSTSHATLRLQSWGAPPQPPNRLGPRGQRATSD